MPLKVTIGRRWPGLILLVGVAVATAEEHSPKRPTVVAVLSTGETVEGALERFSDGEYTLRIGRQSRTFAENKIKSISFQILPFKQLASAQSDKSVEQLIKQFLTPPPRSERSYREEVDASVIPLLAAKGAEAIDPLIAEVGKNSDIYQYVGKIFHEMGPEVMPLLIDRLRKDEARACRLPFYWALRERGVHSLPVIRQLLIDDDPRLREFAMDTLYNIGIQSGTNLPESLTPLIIQKLDDSQQDVSRQAPWVLGMIGGPAEDIVPVLINAVKDPKYGHLDHTAVSGLGSVGKKLRADDPHLKTIIDTLSDATVNHADATVRSYAALQLGYLGEPAHVAIPNLRRATKDPQQYVRERARETLYKFGVAPSKEVSPEGIKVQTSLELVKILVGDDNRASEAARRELISREPTDELCEALMQSVRADEQNRYWPTVAQVFAGWGTKMKVLAKLGVYTRDEHFRVRRTVVFAYGRMKLASVPVPLAKTLEDEHVCVRMSTVDTLCLMSDGANLDLVNEIVPLLVKGLRDETLHRECWWRGARALGEIGPRHPDVVPALIRFLKFAETESFRESAAEELGELARSLRKDHTDMDRIIGALVEALEKETQPGVRGDIIHALSGIGTRAAAALPALRKAADDPDVRVAKTAEKAFLTISGGKRASASPVPREP